jgi:hypothetical protein
MSQNDNALRELMARDLLQSGQIFIPSYRSILNQRIH